MKGLTRRQEEVLGWILDVVEEKGYFPSFREIGEALGLRSPASVSRHINALVKKGYLVREGDRIYPSSKARRQNGIPIVGRVARISCARPIAGSRSPAIASSPRRASLRSISTSFLGSSSGP